MTIAANVVATQESARAQAVAQLQLARGGAMLLLLALLTGGYVAAAMTGSIPADPQIALAAHVTALLGAFWLLAVGWTVPMLRYGAAGLRRLTVALLVANYGGWLITAVKAALHVHGVGYDGSSANRAVFVLLNVVVVLPALGAAGAWALGFRPASDV